MTSYDEIYKAAKSLSPQEQLRLAFDLTKEYDGSPVEAIAEAWATDTLKMIKADKGEFGIDGHFENGRKVQVKSKKANAHRDSATYVTLSKETIKLADDLLVVFVDYETCQVTRAIGPIAIELLENKNGRYYINDMIKKFCTSIDNQNPHISKD